MNIQQLRAQIAVLQDATMDENRNFRTDYDEGRFDALSAVDALLDSLQDEPVSEDLEEAVNAYIGYAPEVDESSSTYGKRQAFKAGAKWQKQKDSMSINKDFEEVVKKLWNEINSGHEYSVIESYNVFYGLCLDIANWQKEQMIAKAVDGYVIEDIEEGNGDFLLSADYLPKSMDLKDRQKVKVIVIKED